MSEQNPRVVNTSGGINNTGEGIRGRREANRVVALFQTPSMKKTRRRVARDYMVFRENPGVLPEDNLYAHWHQSLQTNHGRRTLDTLVKADFHGNELRDHFKYHGGRPGNNEPGYVLHGLIIGQDGYREAGLPTSITQPVPGEENEFNMDRTDAIATPAGYRNNALSDDLVRNVRLNYWVDQAEELVLRMQQENADLSSLVEELQKVQEAQRREIEQQAREIEVKQLSENYLRDVLMDMRDIYGDVGLQLTGDAAQAALAVRDVSARPQVAQDLATLSPYALIPQEDLELPLLDEDRVAAYANSKNYLKRQKAIRTDEGALILFNMAERARSRYVEWEEPLPNPEAFGYQRRQ